MAGAAGFVAATVGGAWVLGWITDDVIVGAVGGGVGGGVGGAQLGLAAAAIIGVSAASGVSVMTRRWFLVMATLRTQRGLAAPAAPPLRGPAFALPPPPAGGRAAGPCRRRLETATMVLNPLAFALSVVLLVLVALAVLLTVHPLLALIAAVLFPALAVISRVYTRLVEAPSAEVQRRVGRVSAVAHESFDGAVVVKTLGRQPMEVERLRAASERLRAERIRVGRMRGTFEPFIDALPTAGTIALLLVGAWLVDRGSASPGDLVLAAMLFSLLAMPLRVVGFFLEEMPRSVVSLERVDGVLDQPVERPTAADKLPAGPLPLDVDGLVVTYGGRRVLDGVSLAVAPGETVALVGATGSGKSTLLEAVAGLIEPAEGTIALGGVPLSRIDRNDLSDAVALVFQEAFLFADSVAENVALRGAADAGAGGSTGDRGVLDPAAGSAPGADGADRAVGAAAGSDEGADVGAAVGADEGADEGGKGSGRAGRGRGRRLRGRAGRRSADGGGGAGSGPFPAASVREWPWPEPWFEPPGYSCSTTPPARSIPSLRARSSRTCAAPCRPRRWWWPTGCRPSSWPIAWPTWIAAASPLWESTQSCWPWTTTGRW